MLNTSKLAITTAHTDKDFKSSTIKGCIYRPGKEQSKQVFDFVS